MYYVLAPQSWPRYPIKRHAGDASHMYLENPVGFANYGHQPWLTPRPSPSVLSRLASNSCGQNPTSPAQPSPSPAGTAAGMSRALSKQQWACNRWYVFFVGPLAATRFGDHKTSAIDEQTGKSAPKIVDASNRVLHRSTRCTRHP